MHRPACTLLCSGTRHRLCRHLDCRHPRSCPADGQFKEGLRTTPLRGRSGRALMGDSQTHSPPKPHHGSLVFNSTIPKSSIALTHLNWWLRLLVARKLHILKLETGALRWEPNKWCDRSGLLHVDVGPHRTLLDGRGERPLMALRSCCQSDTRLLRCTLKCCSQPLTCLCTCTCMA